MLEKAIYTPSSLKIQDWAVQDRPREKLLTKGPHMLTDAELIAILFRSGTKDASAVGLAQQVLRYYDHSLEDLAKRSAEELIQFKGIGEAKALALISALELGRRRRSLAIVKRPIVNNAQLAYQILQGDLSDKTTEEFWVLLLNRSHQLIKKLFISHGGSASTIADPKVIFKKALEYNTSCIILAHNHPSGALQPSKADILLTEKLKIGAQLLDMRVTDHIIFTDQGYYSFAEKNTL